MPLFLRGTAQVFHEYNMLLVLFILCVVLALSTNQEHHPIAASDGLQLAARIAVELGPDARVVLVLRSEDEQAFGDALSSELGQRGLRVVDRSLGDPRAAYQMLERVAQRGESMHGIACTGLVARDYLAVRDAAKIFPALGQPATFAPPSYHWPSFLLHSNLLNVTHSSSRIAIIAIGMTLVIIAGGIDLSVGNLIGLAAVVTAILLNRLKTASLGDLESGLLAAGLAVLLCSIFGALTGSLVTYFQLPPFIVTLAMMEIAGGLAYTLSEGIDIRVPEWFGVLAKGSLVPIGVANPIVLMAMLYVLSALAMRNTVLGRYIYAVGGNATAARLSGVPVRGVIAFTYVVSGCLAGVVGVLFTSQFSSGSASFGAGYELAAITAVVIGGSSLSGGKGKIFGTLLGTLVIAVIQNGMNLLGVISYAQRIILGVIIVGAALVDRWRQSQDRRGN